MAYKGKIIIMHEFPISIVLYLILFYYIELVYVIYVCIHDVVVYLIVFYPEVSFVSNVRGVLRIQPN